MGKEHLDLFASRLSRWIELRGDTLARKVADHLVFFAADPARGCVRAALGFGWAGLAIGFESAIVARFQSGYAPCGV